MTIKWYYAAIGGTAFATTASGQKLELAPTSTTTYYLEATTKAGCKSVRTPITVIVNAKPATPTCIGNVTNVCPDSDGRSDQDHHLANLHCGWRVRVARRSIDYFGFGD